MQTDFDTQTGREASEASDWPPLVHPQETTHPSQEPSTYRTFLISGILPLIARSRRIYEVIDARDVTKRRFQYDGCRSVAWFVRHKATRQVKVASSRCNLRWCPLCIRTKRYIMRQSVTPWVLKSKKPKFLTFTLKHSTADLADQINRLYRAFAKLRQSVLWKKHIAGGMWFFQVKTSKTDGLWHPHLHVIAAGSYIPREELSAKWLAITGDSCVVDVRAIKSAQKTADYVARYAAAPADMADYSDAESMEIFDALAGRRLCGTFGTGKEIQLVPKKCPDASDWEDIGSYWAVINFKHLDADAQAIYFAWKNNTTCEASLAVLPRGPDGEKPGLDEEPITYKQATFDWTEFLK